jgi:hypothetical protein
LTLLGVAKLEVLVLELVTIDRLATSACIIHSSVLWIIALAQEVNKPSWLVKSPP